MREVCIYYLWVLYYGLGVGDGEVVFEIRGSEHESVELSDIDLEVGDIFKPED